MLMSTMSVNIMRIIVRDLTDYLSRALNLELRIEPWEDEEKLPVYLLDRYSFYKGMISDSSCLLMVGKGAEAPALVSKHRRQVEQLWEHPIILVRESLTAYERKRLIGRRIPFIIPHSQAYLPDLGLDLRERFRRQRNIGPVLSPAAQTIILLALHAPSSEFIATTLSRNLKYSRMTLSRALRELEQFGLGTIERRGKERHWKPKATGAQLWDLALPFLRSPVKRRVWIQEPIKAPAAGLTALAQHTMLSPPTLPVCAVRIQDTKWQELPYPDEASTEVEIWLYDPELFAKDGEVDPLSLYLSLRVTDDERVEAALDELMEGIQW
jgi:DNA-binding transcriptional ArsR family regulator